MHINKIRYIYKYIHKYIFMYICIYTYMIIYIAAMSTMRPAPTAAQSTSRAMS